jgi:ditrans,polycis-polyprenyl diphosphate synthase
MGLAKLKLTQIAQHGDLLARYGARIRILGQREMLRADVLEVVERVEELTKGNGDAVLNVCFPYTSRNEIASAVKGVVEEWSRPVMGKERGFSEAHISRAIRSRHLSASHEGAETEPMKQDQPPEPKEKLAAQTPSDTESHSSLASSSTLHPSTANTPLPSQEKLSFPDPETINAETLNLHMLTAENPPLDLLIRTSGVARFSDFMLWQAHENAEVVFTECLWPEFDLWHFLPILVEWQWRRRREVREGRKWEKKAMVKAR